MSAPHFTVIRYAMPIGCSFLRAENETAKKAD